MSIFSIQIRFIIGIRAIRDMAHVIDKTDNKPFLVIAITNRRSKLAHIVNQIAPIATYHYDSCIDALTS